MYLVEASVRPEILRTRQAVLPLEPGPTHPIGLPGSGSVQMVVAGGRGHSHRAGGGGAPAGQSLFPVVDQLPDGGTGRLRGVLLHNSASPRMLPVGCWAPNSPGPSHLPHAPPTLHYHQPCPPHLQEPPTAPTPPCSLGGALHTHWRTPRCSRLYLPPSRMAALCTASMARSMA